MNIGIITVQKAPENYGACLQCFALWKYLTNIGHTCEVIDLTRPWSSKYIRSKRFTEKRKITNSSFYRKLFEKIFNRRPKRNLSNPIENAMFKEFNNSIKYSKTYNCVDELYDDPPIYDAYISGSDQIWNPYMPFINEPYFLTFVPQGKIKLSYASSFAISEIPAGIWTSYSGWLSDFKKISVRESSGINIVKRNFGREAVTVLDPTMLLTRDEWEKMAVYPNTKDDYLLVYTLQYNSDIITSALKFSKNNNLRLKVIVSDTKHENRYKYPEEVELCEAGPKEWMGYIRNAQFVLTDSYHGSVFSILFERNFLTICTNKKVSERLTTLFNTFELQDCFIEAEKLDSISLSELISRDYIPIREKLNRKRIESQQFLIDGLNT